MKKGLKIGLGVIVTGIIIYVLGTFYVNYKIKDYLTNDFIKSNVNVRDVSCNLFTGTVTIKGLSAIDEKNQKTEMKYFKLDGLSYYEFLINSKISIDQIKASDFEIYFPLNKASSSSNSRLVEFKKVSITNGVIYSYDLDTLKYSVHGLNINSENLNFDTQDVAQSINYQIKGITVDSSFVKLNDSEDLKTKRVEIDHQDIYVNTFKINTNLATSDKISDDQVNKDKLDLEVSKIDIHDYVFEINPQLYFSSNLISINKADFEIKANNNTEKNKIITTYSEQLRSAGIKFKINEIQVNESNVSYSEPNKANTKRGAITFDNVEATFTNFHNIKDNGVIKFNTNALFMASNSFRTEFSMDPYDMNNSFKWSGDIKSFDLENMNSFLNPVANMRLKGKVKEYYFSIYGSENTVSADLKINYDDAKIEFFDKSSLSNTLVSGLANLLATNDSDNKLVSKKSTIERSNTESFFNKVWVVQRKGLLEIVKY